jgi:hypothetical protein
MISYQRVNELLIYDPETGEVRWRISPGNGSHAGDIAGTTKGNDYIRIKLDGINYRLHRIIWLMTTGELPEFLDHINGERRDNRWVNLRPVTRLQNNRNKRRYKNSSSEFPGVRKSGVGWRVDIRVQGRNIYLGTYTSLDMAKNCKIDAEQHYFSEFAPNH